MRLLPRARDRYRCIMSKKTFQAPQIEDIGTVEELTLAKNLAEKNDAFYAGLPPDLQPPPPFFFS